MRHVVVVYEDSEHALLDRLVRRLRRDTQENAKLPLEHVTARGAGNLEKLVARMSRAPKKPTAVIAVGDADHPELLVPGFSQAKTAPTFADDLATQWNARLRTAASGDVGVHGIALRWSSESIAIAADDSLRAVLGAVYVDAYLRSCPTLPRDASFAATFPNPQTCLAQLGHALPSPRRIKKMIDVDDVIEHLIAGSRTERDLVRTRVPELDQLVALLLEIERGPADPGEPTGFT